MQALLTHSVNHRLQINTYLTGPHLLTVQNKFVMRSGPDPVFLLRVWHPDHCTCEHVYGFHLASNSCIDHVVDSRTSSTLGTIQCMHRLLSIYGIGNGITCAIVPGRPGRARIYIVMPLKHSPEYLALAKI